MEEQSFHISSLCRFLLDIIPACQNSKKSENKKLLLTERVCLATCRDTVTIQPISLELMYT